MKPAFRVTVNGSDITSKIADRLISLTITDEAGVKSDRIEIVLDDRDQKLAIPPTKAKVTAAIGYDDRLVGKGGYTIEEIEIEGPERRMILRGNAAEFSSGAGAAREKSWNDTTLGGIASSIASKRNWSVSISKELADIQIPHADQHENDLQFLARLAMENGAVAKVTHGRLVIAPHAKGKTTSGKTLPSITINARDCSDWSFTMAERGNYSGVKGQYHNLETGERGESVDGNDDEETYSLPHTYPSKQAAERAAKSKRTSLKAGKATFSIRAMAGKPDLEAECKLKAVGFRTGVDGEWIVSRVTHTLTDSGYISSVECETKGGQ